MFILRQKSRNESAALANGDTGLEEMGFCAKYDTIREAVLTSQLNLSHKTKN